MGTKHEMVCLADFEKFARSSLPKMAMDYYSSGADEEVTLADNRKAFRRYHIVPRVLRDVSDVDMSTTILGHRISFPVCIAPTAMQRMAHPEGEVATARGALAAGIGFTLSTIATSSLEEIADGAPNVLRFFQLYIYRQRDITVQLIRRAEENGFKALLLTVDTPFFGKRCADNRNRFVLPPHLRMANFDRIDFKGSGVNQTRKESGLNEYASALFETSITWKDVAWLKSVTKLPVVLKGILTSEDALLAVDSGVSGIVISNHGGRQLDTVPATIDVLSEIVSAVDGRCEVYLDGGVRTGTDVLKAIALGAKAVFIGRPALYALAYNGQSGVEKMLQILKEEVFKAFALSGYRNVEELHPSMIRTRRRVSTSKL